MKNYKKAKKIIHIQNGGYMFFTSSRFEGFNMYSGYIDLFFELSTFISICWILHPIGILKKRREYHNVESIIAFAYKMYTWYKREHKLWDLLPAVYMLHVNRVCIFILLQPVVFRWLFWHRNAYLWRYWCKVLKPTWIS